MVRKLLTDSPSVIALCLIRYGHFPVATEMCDPIFWRLLVKA